MNQPSLKAALTRIVLTSSLAFGVLATAALAQTAMATKTLIADVPFAFTSGSTPMPAGRYVLAQTTQHMLLLKSEDMSHIRYLSLISVRHLEPTDHSKLIFHRYGDQYFLFQVWAAGYIDGVQVQKSHAEQELILAGNAPQPATTEVASSAGTLR